MVAPTSLLAARGLTDGEDRLLTACYRNALALALEHGLASIAYPAISTGAYGFPPDRAARIALRIERGAQERHRGDARHFDRILEGEKNAFGGALVRRHFKDAFPIK